MLDSRIIRSVAAAAAVAALACSDAPVPPTAPATALPGAEGAAPDGSTLKVTAPGAVSPTAGVEVDDDDPDLVIENAAGHFIQQPPLWYVFEVFDGSDQLVYRSAPVPAGPDGRTSHEITTVLAFDADYSWQAYATADGARGPASPTAQFRTFNRFGPSCAYLGNELAIVQCRRAQFGYLSESGRIDFLRRIAYDLNRVPAEHAPYGLLVKSSGNNCEGYSCDIICSDHERPRQWDVLTDEDSAQLPVWSRLGDIAVRPCEVVQ